MLTSSAPAPTVSDTLPPQRLRVLFVINDLSGGGAEKVLQLLATYLVARGDEVTIVTLHRGASAYEFPGDVHWIVLRTQQFSRGFGKLLAMPLQAWELASILRDRKPDVCVSHLVRSNLTHILTRWFGNRRPVLITQHAIAEETYSSRSIGSRSMRLLIRWLYRRADAAFAVSRAVAGELERAGISRNHIHIVYNPVALEVIRRQAGEAMPCAADSTLYTIITVGRHAEVKDQETLLRAFAVVRRRHPVRLVLVGDGPLRTHLEALARELAIADAVVFAGWQSNPFAWMASADLFVLSSAFEAFGNVLVEAMACGLPVISTDCPGGPREILADGACGVLVPVGDADALAAAMASLIEQVPLRERLAYQARHRAPAFDISVLGPKYAALLGAYSAPLRRSRA